MKGVRVMCLFEVSRGNVDFSSLGGECFLRENSIISIQDRGHPHANPARQADKQSKCSGIAAEYTCKICGGHARP
jgi:hypothetical protein